MLPDKIRQNLASVITGKEGLIPTKNQVLRYFSTLSKKPSYWVFFIHSIVKLKSVSKKSYEEIVQGDLDFEAAFSLLKNNQLDKTVVLLIDFCPEPLPSELCIWIINDEYEHQKGIEFVIIVAGKESPLIIESIIIIKESGAKGGLEILTFENGSNADFTIESSNKELLLNLSLFALQYVANNPIGRFIKPLFGNVEKQNSEMTSRHGPPTDHTLLQYLKESYSGKIKCVKAKVPILEIRPYSLSHAIQLPDQVISEAITYYSENEEHGIVTYIKDGFFVMSDDYATYVAARIMGKEYITVINLGTIDDPSITIISEGDANLLPPIIRGFFPNINQLPNDVKVKLLEDKILLNQRMRRLKELLYSDFEDIKEAIQNDRLEYAINSLIEVVLEKEYKDELLALGGRLSKLKSDSRLGIISYEVEMIQHSRIRVSILRLLNEL